MEFGSVVAMLHVRHSKGNSCARNILKHYRNAPLTKMILSSIIVIISLGDNVIDKLNHLACIQYKNYNAVAHGCRDIVKILRPSQF